MNSNSHSSPRALFEDIIWESSTSTEPPKLPLDRRSISGRIELDPSPDTSFLEVFERAKDPTNVTELCNLYLGRVEASLPSSATIRPELAALWRSSRHRRSVSGEEALVSYDTPGLVKEMYNVYFRDDLYGALRSDDALLLSQGAVSEELWGLPESIKACINYNVYRDWYGYSDSRGRVAARESLASYENLRLTNSMYAAENVVLTMGATSAISSIADFILGHPGPSNSPVLCAIPNYPPLVSSIARRHKVHLVPTPTTLDGKTNLASIRSRLRPDTPLVMLQTATNPTGSLVDEDQLAALINEASPSTMIILDECHEWLGPDVRMSPARGKSNVIRVNSMSKNWSAPGLKVGWLMADAAFVDQFYEYASSAYGGPPSIFYTAVEVMARFERWRLVGLTELDKRHLNEFEPHYMLSLPILQRAYASYQYDRDTREFELLGLRSHTSHALETEATAVHSALYSINIAVDFHEFGDSYSLFRSLYHETSVSVFPGLLSFCLSGGVGRITVGRPLTDVLPAIDRVKAFIAGERRA